MRNKHIYTCMRQLSSLGNNPLLSKLTLKKVSGAILLRIDFKCTFVFLKMRQRTTRLRYASFWNYLTYTHLGFREHCVRPGWESQLSENIHWSPGSLCEPVGHAGCPWRSGVLMKCRYPACQHLPGLPPSSEEPGEG